MREMIQEMMTEEREQAGPSDFPGRPVRISSLIRRIVDF
jgi:hypothetical protein